MVHKGFTRIELIVVIGSVILLITMLLLLPVVSRQRRFRRNCERNLKIIGIAMESYCNDYDGRFPQAGSINSVWARCIKDWDAKDSFGAYGLDPNGAGGQGSISSCLYLLIKYCDLKPESFVCGGDSGVTVFSPVDYNLNDGDLTSLWDFGPSFDFFNPELHVSYSYHTPFNQYALTVASNPGMAVVADRNPWIRSEATQWRTTWAEFDPLGGKKAIRLGNSVSHQEKGQNVLFVDGHVSFERESFCGVNKDNIYTYWDLNRTRDVQKGVMPLPCSTSTIPQDKMDSLLAHGGEFLTFPHVRGFTPEDFRRSFLNRRNDALRNNRSR